MGQDSKKERKLTRSEIMGRVKGKNTSIEIAVRKRLHRQGFRYRVNVKDLPGKPDIVLPKYDTIIYVNGCFWHGHSCKRGSRIPIKNRDYWKEKINKNMIRDKKNIKKLESLGWKVITVWECELTDFESLMRTIEVSIKA